MIRAAIDGPGRYYDEARTIVLRSGLLLADERRHLWHEVVHSDRRDRAGHTDARVERLVEREASERAMPWSALAWAWDRATDLTEVADLLKLPEQWVWFRIKHLADDDKARLRLWHLR